MKKIYLILIALVVVFGVLAGRNVVQQFNGKPFDVFQFSPSSNVGVNNTELLSTVSFMNYEDEDVKFDLVNLYSYQMMLISSYQGPTRSTTIILTTDIDLDVILLCGNEVVFQKHFTNEYDDYAISIEEQNFNGKCTYGGNVDVVLQSNDIEVFRSTYKYRIDEAVFEDEHPNAVSMYDDENLVPVFKMNYTFIYIIVSLILLFIISVITYIKIYKNEINKVLHDKKLRNLIDVGTFVKISALITTLLILISLSFISFLDVIDLHPNYDVFLTHNETGYFYIEEDNIDVAEVYYRENYYGIADFALTGSTSKLDAIEISYLDIESQLEKIIEDYQGTYVCDTQKGFYSSDDCVASSALETHFLLQFELLGDDYPYKRLDVGLGYIEDTNDLVMYIRGANKYGSYSFAIDSNDNETIRDLYDYFVSLYESLEE